MGIAIFLLVIGAFAGVIWTYMQLPQFGRDASGARLDRIQHSSHYHNGAFQNLSETPMFAEGASYFKVMKKYFFGKSKTVMPPFTLPSKKTDLKALDPKTDVVVWFGHSSYFLQLSGKRILVDPVLSGAASPVSFSTKSFKGADIYTPDDLPEIDYLFITHDHYDHLDYKTMLAIRAKVKKVITTLGVGAHLEYWGYNPDIIAETDWNDHIELGDGFRVNTMPARHFSGRKFKRGQTLWASFVLTTPRRRIYIGGDSGYDTHFKAIGDQYGPFDLVMLENGQYNAYWKFIHMMPEEVVQAAIDLNAKRLFPVHWSKFALSIHDWDEPIKRVVAEAEKKGVALIHPLIGDAVILDEPRKPVRWWTLSAN
jgi:L-ascorbate metabolism protein UlaG (beta-lactamase superfamily)